MESPTHECPGTLEEVEVRKGIRDVLVSKSHQAPTVLKILVTYITASDFYVISIKINLFNLT